MKPVDEESNTTPAGMSQTKRIICLVIFLIVCAALSWGAINLPSFTHSKEEPLSDVKAWGIEQVDKLTYVQGEHKQEILERINQANQNGEVRGIVYQAQKDNDEIRVLVAAHRLQSHSSETPCDK